MSDNLLLVLSRDIDRLSNAINKVCDRVERLEEDLAERAFRKKIISFLFTLYPLVMFGLMLVTSIDHQAIARTLDNSQELLNSLVHIVS